MCDITDVCGDPDDYVTYTIAGANHHRLMLKVTRGVSFDLKPGPPQPLSGKTQYSRRDKLWPKRGDHVQ